MEPGGWNHVRECTSTHRTACLTTALTSVLRIRVSTGVSLAGGSLLESPANARKPLANAPVELSVDVFAAVVVVSVRVDRPNIVTTFAIAALTGRVEPDLPGRLPAGGRRNVETDRTRTPARTTDERAERRRGRTRDAGASRRGNATKRRCLRWTRRTSVVVVMRAAECEVGLVCTEGRTRMANSLKKTFVGFFILFAFY
mgnify:CR=1 FL=1